MEQYDGERVVAQDALAIWLRRVMRYREPLIVPWGSVPSLLFAAAAVSANGAHRQRRVTLHSNQEPNTNKTKRERRLILVCQESSINCTDRARIEEGADQQVAKSLTSRYDTKKDTSVESYQNATQA